MDQRLPTLSDVARAAGVSYATADRVVNDRGGVAEKSALRVREAIERLGYVRNVAAANLSQRRTYRFAVILPDGTNAFFARMRELLAAARDLPRAERVEIAPLDVPAFDAGALAARIDGLVEEGADGIAFVGLDAAPVADAMRRARRAGTAILTLVSDVPGAASDGYVGIDNEVAGSTAGRMVGLAHGGRPGRVLPVLGARAARDHAERLAGLRRTLAGGYPALALAPEIKGRDRPEIVEARVAEALREDPEITAIYSAGAGNSGLIRVLERLEPGRRRPVVVLHELVPHARAALESDLVDVVIDQRPEEEIALSLSHLRRIAERRPGAAPGPVVPAIYVRENMPPVRDAAGGAP